MSPSKKRLGGKSTTHLAASPGFSPKKRKLAAVSLLEEIVIDDVALDKLDRTPAPKDKNVSVFFRKNLNILVPGRAVDSEQHMLQEFVRKSNELEATVKGIRQKQMTSVGGAYLQAQAALKEIRVKGRSRK